MAHTEAELLAKIAALETAFERHERTVQFQDRSVTYSTTEEIRSRIAYFRKLLLEVQQGGRRKQTYGVCSKGF